MKTIAIIQARMGATRLPGKVLFKLAGRSVLDHVATRVKKAKRVDGVLVATTQRPGDDPVVEECNRLQIPAFRGSEQDVLGRYFGAARQAGAGAVVRITADCPLFDGSLLDEMLLVFLEANRDTEAVDYLSNVQQRTFPRGLDAEVFTFTALEKAQREATKLYEREHVTPYIYEHSELFRLKSFVADGDLSMYRWTLDTLEDWKFVTAIYEALGPNFSTQNVLNLLAERPALGQLNQHIQQKILHS